MINKNVKIIFLVAMMILVLAATVQSGDIRSTKHNLSISGPGDVAAASESRICIFCHIPHREGSKMPYLWNRSDPSDPYIPYDSSTLKAYVGQPTGASRMCLSCHDGTIALGAIASSPAEVPFMGGIRYMPNDNGANLGTDLSDDHPVSFVYDTTLAQENTKLRDPMLLPSAIRLEDGEVMQCTACHDPHADPFGNFLVMDNAASSLCITCHLVTNWETSAHSQSPALLQRTGRLWANTDYATVAANGCENCHIPHGAGGGERLMIFANEEDNCLDCHDGRIASSDIADVINKPYNHNVREFRSVHDPAEDFASQNVPAHVECSDCHNPHQANGDPSVDGRMVSGANRGVTGISAGGTAVKEARYVYEICFKCHGDNNVIDDMPIVRQIDQLNTRLEFDQAAASFHPVEGPGKNPDVPSLLSPYTTASTIRCMDCHDNDNPAGARGPHGSDWPYLLVDRYVTDDFTLESISAYALCYNCHRRSSLLDDESFVHREHVVAQKTPCSACHDPHGISAMQGNTLHNSHLINFDLSIVLPTDSGRLEFVDQGRFRGTCFLKCHGKTHDPDRYPQ